MDLLLGHGHLGMKAVNMCSDIGSLIPHIQKRPCSLKMTRLHYLRDKKKKEFLSF